MPTGYLKVGFPEKRQVFVNGSPNGLTNDTNQAPVGNKVRVTLEGNDYEPSFRRVDIYPNQTTETSFAKKPTAPAVAASKQSRKSQG